MDDADVVRARPLVVRFVRAVAASDPDEMETVACEIQMRFGAAGPQALAVMTAGVLIDTQGALKRQRDEATRYAEAYLDQKRLHEEDMRRVKELRMMLEERGKDIGRLKAELNEIKTANVAA
jgi:hypothetical protein